MPYFSYYLCISIISIIVVVSWLIWGLKYKILLMKTESNNYCEELMVVRETACVHRSLLDYYKVDIAYRYLATNYIIGSLVTITNSLKLVCSQTEKSLQSFCVDSYFAQCASTIVYFVTDLYITVATCIRYLYTCTCTC